MKRKIADRRTNLQSEKQWRSLTSVVLFAIWCVSMLISRSLTQTKFAICKKSRSMILTIWSFWFSLILGNSGALWLKNQIKRCLWLILLPLSSEIWCTWCIAMVWQVGVGWVGGQRLLGGGSFEIVYTPVLSQGHFLFCSSFFPSTPPEPRS